MPRTCNLRIYFKSQNNYTHTLVAAAAAVAAFDLLNLGRANTVPCEFVNGIPDDKLTGPASALETIYLLNDYCLVMYGVRAPSLTPQSLKPSIDDAQCDSSSPPPTPAHTRHTVELSAN